MKRPTENRLPATAAPVPRLLRRIAVLGCIALAFGLGSCDSKKENAKPPSDETPPVAETPLAKAAIQGDLTEISQQLKSDADIKAAAEVGTQARLANAGDAAWRAPAPGATSTRSGKSLWGYAADGSPTSAVEPQPVYVCM